MRRSRLSARGERRSSAVYLDIKELPGGEPVPIGRKAMTFPAHGYLAFVDPFPTANWGHPCRYLFVESETQRIAEIPAQFPPFLSAVSATLRLIWKGRTCLRPCLLLCLQFDFVEYRIAATRRSDRDDAALGPTQSTPPPAIRRRRQDGSAGSNRPAARPRDILGRGGVGGTFTRHTGRSLRWTAKWLTNDEAGNVRYRTCGAGWRAGGLGTFQYMAPRSLKANVRSPPFSDALHSERRQMQPQTPGACSGNTQFRERIRTRSRTLCRKADITSLSHAGFRDTLARLGRAAFRHTVPRRGVWDVPWDGCGKMHENLSESVERAADGRSASRKLRPPVSKDLHGCWFKSPDQRVAPLPKTL